MRSIAETWKMARSHIQQQWDSVASSLCSCCMCGCTCFTVDGAAAAAYCTPEGAAILSQQVVFCTTISPSQRVFTKIIFSNMVFTVRQHVMQRTVLRRPFCRYVCQTRVL